MNRAQDWKRRFKKPQQADVTAEIELNGFKFIGRRPPLEIWIRSGRMPQSLFEAILKLEKREIDEITPETVNSGDTVALLNFQRDLVLYAVKEPRIVLADAKDDEILYQELVENEPELVEAIISWVIKGCEGIPVKTKEGEVSVESLSGFRQKRPGGLPAWARTDSADVRDEAERAAIASG